jgi:PAS domain S-box-containing protein
MHVNQHALSTIFDSHGPANILVVDDVSQNLKLLSDMLIDVGHTVRPARNGRIAIESARRQPPDLVLLDIRMPEIDGFEVCRQLKADPTTADVPIIFISALEDSQDKVRAFEAGGVDYITKPFQQSEVLSRVNTHLSLSGAHKKLEAMVTHRTEQLEETNRALRLLSRTNQILVRAEEKSTFLHDICNAVVELGGFPFCCVGLPENPDLTEWTIDQCSRNAPGYEHPLAAMLCDSRNEHSPLLQSFRNRSIVVVRNFAEERTQTSCGQTALNHKLASCMCLPLGMENDILGVVAIFSDRHSVFDDEEVGMFKELGKDIALGIHTLQERAKRQAAERALDTSELRYRTLFEKAGDGILVLSAGDTSDGCVTEVNRTAAVMLGYSAEELIGLHYSRLIAPEEQERFSIIRKDILAGKWINEESVHRKKDGTTFPAEVSLGYIDADRQGYIIIFLRDISTRKKLAAEKKALEDQIRQANKMEAIGTLATGIAHDFNNILFAISGFTELSIEFAPPESMIRNNLLKIQHANRRAAELVSQILTLSRQKECAAKALQPKLVVKEAVKLLRATLPSTIDIKTEIHSEAYIMADATQIHQIVMNLCVNANHAMETLGGVLTISLLDKVVDDLQAQKNIDLTAGKYIEFSVADTGTGIPEHIKDKVFDPYFTTKPQEKGTGLGLSVVHGIVKSYGGHISIVSQENHGCTVTVLLPAIDAQQKEEERPDLPLTKGSETVLFVDDEEILIEIGRQMLEMLGYKVVTRSNGPDALALYKEDPQAFDLVITDYTMPKMIGTQLAKAILEINPTQPIILVSGREAAITKEEAEQCGIRSFIRKPVILKEIATAVRQALEPAKELQG